MAVPERTIDLIIDIVDSIPPGSCMTYGAIGDIAGIGPRFVARVMALAPDAHACPWHRVVGAGGEVKQGPHSAEQKRRLMDEGFTLRNNRIIDFPTRRFHP
jgi:methylated-DNA-protein-cysteine methyltransferase-like protein